MGKVASEVAAMENDAPVVKITQYIAAPFISYTAQNKLLIQVLIFVTLTPQARALFICN
jgi:hypothetical protein